MQISDVALWVTTGTALLVAVGGLFQQWRTMRDSAGTPKLTEAQTDTQVVTAEQMKNEIKRQTQEGNIWRDLRILDLERWGDAMRPYLSARDRREDQMLELIREDRARCGLPMPEIAPLPPAPPYPEPRPLPA